MSIDRIEAIVWAEEPEVDFASDIFPTYILVHIGKVGPIFLVHTVSPHVSIYRRSDRCQWDPILYPLKEHRKHMRKRRQKIGTDLNFSNYLYT